MNVLGISAFYHDSSACILVDGVLVAAMEEERLTRVKHDNSFPVLAIKKCLELANLSIEQIDLVAYYEKPVKKLERVLETFVVTYPFSIESFVKKMPELLLDKLDIPKVMKKQLGYKGKIMYVPHHLSHAAAGFYTSPFRESAVLVVDGVGEEETITMWEANAHDIVKIGSINFPHSLGLLYSTFTAYLGFRVNSDEYKMMGLAAYGVPKYANQVRKLFKIKNDGGFELDLKYFSFQSSIRKMWSPLLEELLGAPRSSKQNLTQRHKDIAASIQIASEEIYIALVNKLSQICKSKNLCIAGGVGLNSLANGKLYASTMYENIHIYGPAGDSGASLGAAYLGDKQSGKGIKFIPPASLSLGSEIGSEIEIEDELKRRGYGYVKFESEKELLTNVATKLYKGKVVGWVNGRMEFGPRALGNRSILARTYPRKMKDRVNRIKMREQFRPFAVSVLENEVEKWFETPKDKNYFPHMNHCFVVKEAKEGQLGAVVHADKTCRIQTVNEIENGRYFRLIKKYRELSEIPCLLNTSFNTKKEPIVESLSQVIDDLREMSLDYLVVENFVIRG